MDPKKYWPHAPYHACGSAGTYMVTGATYQRQHIFREGDRMSELQVGFLALAERYGIAMQAWALFSNHYHFIGRVEEDGSSIKDFATHFHANSARWINQIDGTPGRRVWYQYWDKDLTFQVSYMARMRYVMNNPVRHRLVKDAKSYPWCSAAWFESTTGRAFRRSVLNFPIDRLEIDDEYNPLLPSF